jgi:tRNA U34 5-methylaminomethyl-2-thiouridine-forming methyltransferase MnmC
MVNNLPELIKTSDGSHTLYVKELNEHFHSVHGAVQESEIVFIRNGFDFCKAEVVNILEIGFGTGLNALLTLARSLKETRRVNYTAVEKYPLSMEITGRLNYDAFTGNESEGMLTKIHSAPWNEKYNITDDFALTKLNTDFTKFELTGLFNLIYFDAFGPDKQPEMWEESLFRKIAALTDTGSILVTYSAKGTVKRALRASGFIVSLLPGPPGKRQVIRAVKI